MTKPSVLILSYSHLRTDPRIKRQISALANDFSIETAGLSPCDTGGITHHSIYEEPPFSLFRKIKRSFQFISGMYEAYYWDDFKKSVKAKLKLRNYNVIISNDIHTLPLAVSIAGPATKIYFDAHEYHPKEFEDSFKWRLFYKNRMVYFCKKYIPKTNAFSTVSENIAKAYFDLTGKLPVVITNATFYQALNPGPVNDRQIKLVHHGAAIRSRKLELMIDMASDLPANYSLDLVLTDLDKEYLRELKQHAEKTKNVRIIPPVPTNKICEFINAYDLGVYILPPSNFNNLNALPNKFFEFVQARLGIVVSPNPEMAQLVRNYRLGVVSPDYSGSSMARVIQELSTEEIAMFKKNANENARHLSAEENMKKIREIVSSLISPNKE